ncbi:hypothetical protein G9A89_020136 [Geosiphon pyriformis]|nr:hypothetical protein G9A89_020136 [Geosiphon pyriformis]
MKNYWSFTKKIDKVWNEHFAFSNSIEFKRNYSSHINILSGRDYQASEFSINPWDDFFFRGQKVAFGPLDKVLMEKFEQFASYSSLGYCLDFRNQITPGFFAKAEIIDKGLFRKDLVVYFLGTSSIFNSSSVSSNKKVPTRDQWYKQIYHLIPFSTLTGVLIVEEFYSVFMSAFILLENMMRGLLNSPRFYQYIKTITFTGHGIGGVFALLYGIFFRLNSHYYKVEIFTYGQPAIGNQEFARFVSGLNAKKKIETWRITHSDDYVPRLHKILNTGLVHNPHEIWIDTSCECNGNNYTVYLCEGRLINYFSTESMECNYASTTDGEYSNFGPYFGHKMGECPHPSEGS